RLGHARALLAVPTRRSSDLAALDWAAAEARRLGWRLHVVCAYAVPAFTVASLDGGFAAVDDSAIQAGAQAVLDEAVERVGDELRSGEHTSELQSRENLVCRH